MTRGGGGECTVEFQKEDGRRCIDADFRNEVLIFSAFRDRQKTDKKYARIDAHQPFAPLRTQHLRENLERAPNFSDGHFHGNSSRYLY